jgi:hypothetical protein
MSGVLSLAFAFAVKYIQLIKYDGMKRILPEELGAAGAAAA